MRILHIVHGFPPEAIGGTETYAEALSRCLLTRGHECVVLAGSGRVAPEPSLSIEDQNDLLVTRYVRVTGQPDRWTAEYDADAEGLVRRLLALVNPDVVHLHHWRWLTNNLVAICADLGIPKVVTLHDAWTTCPRIHRIRGDGEFCSDPVATAPCMSCAERSPWQGDEEIARALTLRREMMEAELALADAVIVPSEAHRRFIMTLLDLPEDRLIVLPHGALPTLTARQGRGRGREFPQRPLQIGHWGYLIDLKGTHLILEAVHRLRDPSAVQLHLIGTAGERAYEQRLRELAQGIPVQFHGAYGPADLEGFDLDLAVFASIASESYSFALDEALRLGLPVLVPDRGALPERIGSAGLTFRAGDAGDLARRFQEILDAPEVLEAMRRGIRPETLFSMEAHVTMLEKIYEDAAHASTPKRESPTPYLKLIAHAKRQLLEREAVLLEREAALAELQSCLAQSQQALHDTGALLEQTRRTLERLQADHASLLTYVQRLKQTPLVRLHELLTRLSGGA